MNKEESFFYGVADSLVHRFLPGKPEKERRRRKKERGGGMRDAAFTFSGRLVPTEGGDGQEKKKGKRGGGWAEDADSEIRRFVLLK